MQDTSGATSPKDESAWALFVNSGISARRAHDPAKAATLFRLALKESQLLAFCDGDWSRTQHSLALLLDVLGERAKAEKFFRGALVSMEASPVSNDWKLRMILDHTVDCLLAQEKYREAEPLFVRALAIDEQHFGADHWLLTGRLMKLRRLYELTGQSENAERVNKRLERVRLSSGSLTGSPLRVPVEPGRLLLPPPGKES